MRNVALVIPVLNRKETTQRCLDSVYSCLPDGFTVIVIDSGSTDGTQSMIKDRFGDAVLIQGNHGQWWAAATNLGVKRALLDGHDGVLTFNDDNVATPDLFKNLLDTAAQYPKSIISAVCCYHHIKDKVFFAGRRRSPVTGRFHYLHLDKPYAELKKEILEVDLLHGMCTLFPATVFHDTGFFDEVAFPHLFADDDLVLRAKKTGYRLLVNTRARVMNDRAMTGLNPYNRRLNPKEVIQLFTSRKSVFQIKTRTRFLWKHRYSFPQFIINWCADYFRIICLVILRWILPGMAYDKLIRIYLKFAYK